MRPGSSWVTPGYKVSVLPNNHRMSRSVCSICAKHCSQNVVYQCSGLIFCSRRCAMLAGMRKQRRDRKNIY
ncbi:hypothetical protein ARALYDRAFT_920607 [Arabidopsis lyrata subsp. lyrata]|uniref:DC1-like C-terminal domain-containing protein n=1 Tax=Arabidopsis lyrata subsp. lyrata TaxID=81972 RepID=D7MXF6_ARALL|nr:hypothetical protein ARALYDRAFT_920607 [Arabidopsis lyrata subsp. lyrata]